MKFLPFLLPFLFIPSAYTSSCGTNGEVCSSNMNMPIPAVGVTKGPQYATDINNSLLILDKHNHTPGYGVPITPAGLNITSDLTLQGNNLTNTRAARFSSQGSPISAVSPDIGEIYVSGADLYYNDTNGNQVRITQSGSVTGSSGTITGLPSGTASAAYNAAAGNFVFQKASSTAAQIDAGSYILRYSGAFPSPGGNFIIFQAPPALATGYSLTYPATLPSTTGSWLTSDTGGNLSWTAVDNSTLQYVSNVVSVKNQGITQNQILNNTITTNQIAIGANIHSNQIANDLVTGNLSASAGIVGTQLANGTLTTTQISPTAGILQTQMALNPSGQALSSGPYTFAGTTYTTVNNQALNLAVAARLVAIEIIPAVLGTDSYISCVGTGTCQVSLNAGSLIGEITMKAGDQIPPSAFRTMATLAAGTYSFNIQVRTSSGLATINVHNVMLNVYQL